MRVNNELENRHFYNVGVSGSGKSYAAKKIITKANPKRILIYDTKRELQDGFLGCKKINSIEKLYYELLQNKEGKYILTPSDRSDYNKFCDLAMAWGNADYGLCYVYIEEAGSVSRSGKATHSEYQLLTQSRAYGIVVCYVSSDFAGATVTALKCIDRFRIGRTVPQAISYIRTNLNAKLADLVNDLEGHQGYYFDLKTNTYTQDF